MVPWAWIVDETREIEHRPGFEHPDAFMETVTRSYRKDRWAMQPERVIVVSEKGTVAGLLRPVIHQYGVPLGIYHGYSSATALNDLAARSAGDSRPLTILYVGDHDPSGRHMSDVDIPERVARYGGQVRIERVAVTPKQIVAHYLPTFAAAEKKNDARYPWFIKTHGHLCCELDALDPNLLRQLVEAAIRRHLDLAAWARADRVEAAERASLQAFLAGYPGVTATEASA
jgi:hypothetical protein